MECCAIFICGPASKYVGFGKPSLRCAWLEGVHRRAWTLRREWTLRMSWSQPMPVDMETSDKITQTLFMALYVHPFSRRWRDVSCLFSHHLREKHLRASTVVRSQRRRLNIIIISLCSYISYPTSRPPSFWPNSPAIAKKSGSMPATEMPDHQAVLPRVQDKHRPPSVQRTNWSSTDPRSPQFDPQIWARQFQQSRAEANQDQFLQLGLAFRGLTTYGFGKSTDDQSTVGTVALKLMAHMDYLYSLSFSTKLERQWVSYKDK
jgi:hypothetical protein